MVKITSDKELEKWLEDKPIDWSQIIAARAALRVLPFALNNKIISRNSEFTLTLLRATSISWAAHNIPAHGMATAAAHAADAADAAAYAAANAAAYAATAAADAVATTAAATDAAATTANDAAADTAAIWQSIEEDIGFLESHDSNTASMALTAEPLWFANQIPSEIQSQWLDAKPKLLKSDSNYIHWTDWYQRRLIGNKSAFDIPHDKDRIEDKAILIKLADATNEDFWDKGAEYVNAQLDQWLRDARQRAQERYEQENADLVNNDSTPKIPEQNSNAITFKAGSNGKIAIDVQASLDEILSDEDSQERHQMALDEAKALQEKCATSNSGAQLSPLLESYIENLGSSIEQIRPSLSVLKGEKLRQTLAAYQSKNSMMQPLSDDLLVDLNNWQSAHNMMVAFQPKLNALDTAMLGPDRQPAVFTPDDLRTLTKDAENSELLEEGTKEILNETADLTPLEFDPDNRRIKWTAETAKNLLIETAKIAKSHPRKTGVTGAVTAIAIANPAISIPLATAAALFLIKHRKWVEEKMGNTPTWKSIFVSICEQYDEIVSFNKNREGNN